MLWGFLEHIPPNGVTGHSNPQKAPPCAETRRLSHQASAPSRDLTCGEDREKK